MFERPLRPSLALASALLLSLSLAGVAGAHAEDASPAPASRTVTEDQAEGASALETRRAERAATREQRRAEREERADDRAERMAERAERLAERAERMAERAERMAERAERREQRAADRTLEREERREARREQRAARRAARAEVLAACASELRAVREADLEGADRREAWRAAREACRQRYLEVREAVEAGAFDTSGPDAAAMRPGLVATTLGTAEPGSAPGQELGLWHFRIPAQTELDPHTHPGWQLARVTDGELEYTVLEGEGILLRGDTTGRMGPGTYLLQAGDGVIENPALVHQAANRSDEPVTIISATLYAAGADPSTPVEND